MFHLGISLQKWIFVCIFKMCLCINIQFHVLKNYLQAIFMIPTKPPPSFRNPDKWTSEFIDFVSKCLVKNPEQRVSAAELMQVRLPENKFWKS